MNIMLCKSIRRLILKELYRCYQQDPLEMVEPEVFLKDGAVERDMLAFNMHYLADHGLVEQMMGYHTTLFTSARITAKGMDVVENQFRFDLMFPPFPEEAEQLNADIPALVERLADAAEYTALDGDRREALLRDAAYLRAEVSRPYARWRMPVLMSVLDWLDAEAASDESFHDTLEQLRQRLAQVHESLQKKHK